MSAPAENQNRTTHGVRGLMVNGTVPKGAIYAKRRAGALGRAVEVELLARHGEITLGQAALVNGAVRAETRYLLAARWLREQCDKLPITDRLGLLREMSNATEQRNKIFKELGLLAPPASADPWREFDRTRTLTPSLAPPASDTRDATAANASPAIEQPANAPGATSGDGAANNPEPNE